MPNDAFRPSIIIRTNDSNHEKRSGRGGPPKPFGDVAEAQKRIGLQIDEVRERLNQTGAAGTSKVGIARLKYAERAIAKSHRATEVFNDSTCPVVGDLGGPGDLLILVNPIGLDNLKRTMQRLNANSARHLTGIETFELVGLERRFPLLQQAEVGTTIAREGTATLNIRVVNTSLFSETDRAEVEEHLHNLFGSRVEPYVTLGNFALYSVTVSSMEQAMSIAGVQAVHKVELMPVYFVHGVGSIDIAALTVNIGSPIEELPIVAVVDTGIEPGTKLESLVWKRELRIPPAEMNTTHGTAVAALATSGGKLGGNTIVPVARVLDAAVMPGQGGISQVNLIDILEELLELYAVHVKDWNLSLARTPSGQPTEFSDLGQILDLFQRKYGVQFYFAAGNCDEQNCRMTWPIPAKQALNDYVSAPGDAVCGITVGSCAPVDTPNGAAVPAWAPAPYSGRGPVAGNVQKPDLVIPEGNLMPNREQVGLPSLRPNGEVRNDMVGTSFAAPIVSSIGAELRSCLALSGLPTEYQELLIRAMMIQRASLPAVFGTKSIRPIDYYGYGRVTTLDDMLGDPAWRSTSFILATLYPDTGELVIGDLPYPDSLRSNGLYRGRVLLTVVSAPLLDPSFKSEYVRSNVDVTLRVLQLGSDGKLHPQPPADYLRLVGDHESRLIKEQRKWSSVKQYRSPNEIKCKGEHWELCAKLLLRDLEYARTKRDPTCSVEYGVPVVIAITIEDPTQQLNINDEMVLKWRERGFVTEDVQIQPRIKNRLEGI